ncbi:MAG: gamma carbonic anhydrase family protein [Parvularculaceae bacterium]
MKPLILPFEGKTPKIHDTAFIAPGAVLIGDVEIGPEASVWYNCVLRGDVNAIRIGARSNIQDGSVLHADAPDVGGSPCIIGEAALIGHLCMLHGCRIENNGFVGMKATVLDGVVVQSGAIVAACAFVTPGKVVKTGEMWAGAPAKMLRELKGAEDAWAAFGTDHYVKNAARHAAALDAASRGAG